MDKAAASNERSADYRKQWQKENRDRCNETARRWRNGNKTKAKAATRIWALRTKYGITPDQLDEMSEAQSRSCAVCLRVRPLVVDHDHSTGVVRGLLCSQCNTMLGLACDDSEILSRAISYLSGNAKLVLRAVRT